MKWALAGFVLLHALLHGLGVAKGFGLAELPALKLPVTRPAAVGWLVALCLLLATSILIALGPTAAPRGQAAWVIAGLAALVSQVMIVSSWSDARFGTVANVILLIFAGLSFASYAPVGLRAEYRARAHELSSRSARSESTPLTHADVAALPAALQRYLEVSGAIGRPVPSSFRARWRGRIRSGPTSAWMPLEAEQFNVVAPAARLFWMDATMLGMPALGLHAYQGEHATMEVRAFGLFTVATGGGAEMTKAETVTLFNDLCMLAPGALAIFPIRWTELGPDRIRGEFTNAGHTIHAELVFADDGMLVDFRSADRGREVDGVFVDTPWSTPLSAAQEFGGLTLASHGEARWTPAGQDSFAYIELELVEVLHDPPVGE